MWDFNFYGSSLIFWGAIVLIVLVSDYYRYKTQSSRHRMIETMVQKGQPIPPEMLTTNPTGYGLRQRSPIESGIFLMCIGIALAIFFWAMSGGGNLIEGHGAVPHWLPVVGIFPFMVGLARLLGGIFDRRPPPPL